MMKEVLVEVSARHVHLSNDDLAFLFGEGYELTHKKDLSQPDQYACEERVTLVGDKGELKNVIILGPTRKNTQIELSLTDARSLGVKALVRESGDIEGTFGCKIIGPKGELTITKGVIAAKRHIHMTVSDAAEINVKNGDVIKLQLDTEDRSLVFDDVVVRVSDKFATAVHLDTDEANAAGFVKGNGTIIL
ncbi:MAG: phosphate propanoyltransferase [Erysipelotrichaceae bacterium]